MESSSTPQTNGNPQTSNQGTASEEQPRKRTNGFSRESLLNNLEEIAKEAEEIKQELPEEPKQVDTAAIKRQVEILDKRQVLWIWLYRGWLLWNVWQRAEMEVVLVGDDVGEAILSVVIAIVGMLVMIGPYMAQIFAMLRKSLRLSDIALKMMVVFACLGLIKMTFLSFMLYDSELFLNLSENLVSQLNVAGVEIQLAYPPKEGFQMVFLIVLVEFLVDFVLTYGGARLYKRYLLKRQALLFKEKNE